MENKEIQPTMHLLCLHYGLLACWGGSHICCAAVNGLILTQPCMGWGCRCTPPCLVLSCTEDRTQGFMHASQVLHQLSCIFSHIWMGFLF